MPHVSAMPGRDIRPIAVRLTPRETEILRMIAKGKFSAEIGAVLGMAEKTVDHHRANMRRKLDVTSALEAVTQGLAHGILACPCRERVSQPKPRMTPREQQVLGLMARGCTSKDVARLLNIEVKTAETHRQNVLARLNVGTGIEAVAAAMAHGIIECPCENAWDYFGA